MQDFILYILIKVHQDKTSYLRVNDGDLLRDGVDLGVDLGVDPADRSPGGLQSCRLRMFSFSSGTTIKQN